MADDLLPPTAMSNPNVKFYNAAIDAAQTGDLPAAREAIESALTEDPNDTQSWQLYAVVLNALGETEKAEKAIAKTKELGLSDVDELIMKAADAIGQNKFGIAITHYEDALELEPNRPEVYVSYALALMQGDYPSDAEVAADKAVEMAPEDASAWYARGRIQRLRGKMNEALVSLNKALELQGNLVLAKYECGMILAETGELKAALACFEDVLVDHPDDGNAIEAKAVILARMEETNS
jgi:tetratricopeptide (TPR) repeat protein